MRFRSTTHKKNSTEELPKALNFLNMKKRVNQIKFRSSSRSFNVRKSKLDIQPQQQKRQKTIILKRTPDMESDSNSTNFWPSQNEIPITITSKISSHQYILQKRSQDSRLTINRPQSHVMYSRNRFRTLKKEGRCIDEMTYQKEISYFARLYELLANVLVSIKNGLEDVQTTVSKYGEFIRDPYLTFIDDFVEGRSEKIQKTVKISRIYEYLSIAYLFLEISQGRIDNNQSYLINFIGYSLSNLIFTSRIYILLERRPEFEINQFEKQLQEFEITSFKRLLTNMDDILFRMQHNNEIITMIHKKLGKWNEKFQECIITFLKTAERKKYTACLCAHYIFEYLAMHIHESGLVGISQYLEVAPTPYLAPPKHDYTLVFEPLGILGNQSHFRPYLMQFVQWASKYFDLVLWTWEMPSQVGDIVEKLQPYLFSKLYRYHCVIKDEVFTKDLNRLGRDLKKTLIIDYDERIFADTPKNGFVARWSEKPKDKGLLIISEILQEMVGSESEVQDTLTFYSQQLYSVRGV